MVQENRVEQRAERQSIWSVPGHLWRWYTGIFAVQYLLFLGLTVWEEVAYGTAANIGQSVLSVQRGMTASILNLAASTYLILEAAMLAQWLREREQRKQQEAAEQARLEVAEWRAWYERMQAAQREGKPFAEPPPSAAHPDNSRRK